MSSTIEIQTIEGGRLEWVSIFHSTDDRSAVDWGNCLLSGFTGKNATMKPNLRITNNSGKVTGAWQSEGWFEPVQASPDASMGEADD